MTTIKNLIYIVRDVQVMLDADLAALYGYSTKAFNQQVKNNIAKFDNDFRFQLTSDEYHEILRSKNLSLELPLTSFESKTNDDNQFLRSKNLTSKIENRGGRQYLLYVFTEQGIYMLMTVLKLPLVMLLPNLRPLTFLRPLRAGGANNIAVFSRHDPSGVTYM